MRQPQGFSDWYVLWECELECELEITDKVRSQGSVLSEVQPDAEVL